jgi:hypothetical protein
MLPGTDNPLFGRTIQITVDRFKRQGEPIWDVCGHLFEKTLSAEAAPGTQLRMVQFAREPGKESAGALRRFISW